MFSKEGFYSRHLPGTQVWRESSWRNPTSVNGGRSPAQVAWQHCFRTTGGNLYFKANSGITLFQGKEESSILDNWLKYKTYRVSFLLIQSLTISYIHVLHYDISPLPHPLPIPSWSSSLGPFFHIHDFWFCLVMFSLTRAICVVTGLSETTRGYTPEANDSPSPQMCQQRVVQQ